jgi:hypothetical protein
MTPCLRLKRSPASPHEHWDPGVAATGWLHRSSASPAWWSARDHHDRGAHARGTTQHLLDGPRPPVRPIIVVLLLAGFPLLLQSLRTTLRDDPLQLLRAHELQVLQARWHTMLDALRRHPKSLIQPRDQRLRGLNITGSSLLAQQDHGLLHVLCLRHERFRHNSSRSQSLQPSTRPGSVAAVSPGSPYNPDGRVRASRSSRSRTTASTSTCCSGPRCCSAASPSSNASGSVDSRRSRSSVRSATRSR